MGRDWTKEISCALHVFASTDGMTADYSPFNHDFLSHTANHIINGLHAGVLAQSASIATVLRGYTVRKLRFFYGATNRSRVGGKMDKRRG